MERGTALIITRIYAVLAWIGAIFTLLAALALFGIGIGTFGGAMLAGLGAGVLAGMGAFLAFLFVLFALLDAFIGVGLWQCKNWARILMIIFGVLGLFSIFSLFVTPVQSAVNLAIALFTIWFFGFCTTTKALFTGAPAPVAAPVVAVNVPVAKKAKPAAKKPAKKSAKKKK